MTRRIPADPLALKVTRTFYDYLMGGTAPGRQVNAGHITGQFDPHLLSILRKIQLTTPRPSTGIRLVAPVDVPELDALAPYAMLMRTTPGDGGSGRVRALVMAGRAACGTIEDLRERLAADDPSQVSALRYPLHNRLRLAQVEADTAVRLLDWLMGPGSPVVLAEPDPSRPGVLRQVTAAPRALVLAYLEIDPDELAREALRMHRH